MSKAKKVTTKKVESTMSKARKVYARMFKSAVKKDGADLAVVNRQKFLTTMIEKHNMTANGASSYFTSIRDQFDIDAVNS